MAGVLASSVAAVADPPAPAPVPDRFAAIAGSWSCVSTNGVQTSHVYEAKRDGSIELTNLAKLENAQPITERYGWDARKRLWTLQGAFGFSAMARPWTDDALVFDGHMTELPRQPEMRVVYTYVDATHFKRDFGYMREGTWVPGTGETCTKGG